MNTPMLVTFVWSNILGMVVIGLLAYRADQQL
ncbi:Uncharacterised protein [Serratia fonticola]|uniref:Uncharacterized protein n=1 Tax=Serratia fonticola TaxID=47917 RepID=A0A4U9VI87_SERFO|nr:Uncharacterised protein [Serratia fonticola]